MLSSTTSAIRIQRSVVLTTSLIAAAAVAAWEFAVPSGTYGNPSPSIELPATTVTYCFPLAL